MNSSVDLREGVLYILQLLWCLGRYMIFWHLHFTVTPVHKEVKEFHLHLAKMAAILAYDIFNYIFLN